MAALPTHASIGFPYNHLHDFTCNVPSVERPAQMVRGAWEIRLIRLRLSKTNNYNAPIQCDLFHATFSEVKRCYEALSYVWADDMGIPHDEIPSPCDISVNGVPFPVTPNLYTALLRLRGRGDGAGRLFWVDQICINQNDATEKSWLVDRMSLIYGYAKQTTIWLGGDADGSFRALFLISRLAEIARLPTREDQVAAVVGGYAARARWAALGKLMERRWWYRTWTVQECVLPRLGSLFVRCGAKEVPWTDFVSAVRLMDGLRDAMPLCVGLVNISPLLELQLGRRRAAARGEDIGDGGGELDSLLEALARYRGRLATDPRDKVYAIMRMARDIRDASEAQRRLLHADYNKPAEDVYTDTARFFVETGKTLEFLGHCRLTRNLACLPSWVPDWSDSSSYPRPLPYFDGLAACADGGPEFQISGTCLAFKGRRMGSVGVLGEPCLEEHVSLPRISELFIAWRAILINYLTAIDTSDEIVEGHVVGVLVAGRGPRKEPLDRGTMDEFVAAYRLWSCQPSATASDADEWPISEAMNAVRFTGSVRRACVGRRVFVSPDGFVGLAPQETAETDFMVSNARGDQFLVLRQTSTVGCTLVGPWYVSRLGDLLSLEQRVFFCSSWHSADC